ncbi:MAG: hypothetical protein IIA82_05415, partial [Thaumarchaeota archaeon]|nr:hypothetical protein [Nitrososphaerota archaeon]
MSVLVLGFASYPPLLPNSENSVDAINDLQLQLASVAFAQEAETEDGTEDGTEELDIPEIEDETDLKVQAKIIGDQSRVKVKKEFSTLTIDRTALIDEIIAEFALSRGDADAALKLEIEEDEGLSERFRVQARVDDGVAEVRIELKFVLDTTDRNDILDAIVSMTQLSIEQIDEVLDFEAEDTDEEEVETTINQVTVSNLSQDVSNFVDESWVLFEQQGVETKAVIQDCRDAMRDALPSERQDVRQDCRDNLNAIRDSYKVLRQTYKDTFKEFRENMKVLIKESRGQEINQAEKAAALANIESLSQNEDKREKIKELQQQMREETKKEKKELREQMKKDREIAREMMKDEREAMKEAMKDQREAEREAMKDQKEMMQKERETLRDAEDVAKAEEEAAEDVAKAEEEAAEDVAKAEEEAAEDVAKAEEEAAEDVAKMEKAI